MSRAAGAVADGLMGWKRLQVGGQLGFCCHRAELTAAGSASEAAVYRDRRGGEGCGEAPVSEAGEMQRTLGTE